MISSLVLHIFHICMSQSILSQILLGHHLWISGVLYQCSSCLSGTLSANSCCICLLEPHSLLKSVSSLCSTRVSSTTIAWKLSQDIKLGQSQSLPELFLSIQKSMSFILTLTAFKLLLLILICLLVVLSG